VRLREIAAPQRISTVSLGSTPPESVDGERLLVTSIKLSRLAVRAWT
jgi:hypothetical protein